MCRARARNVLGTARLGRSNTERCPDVRPFATPSPRGGSKRADGKVQHMSDYEELAVDFIKLPPRARPRNWKAVTTAEVAELLREQPVIPGRDLAQPVVGDHEGARLCGREMIEAKCGHLGNANFATGEVPAVTHDYVTVAIDQDWDIEAESLDAVGNLPDLPLTVPAWVAWIRFELVDRPVDDQYLRRKAGRLAVGNAKVLRQRGKLPSISPRTPRHCES